MAGVGAVYMLSWRTVPVARPWRWGVKIDVGVTIDLGVGVGLFIHVLPL